MAKLLIKVGDEYKALGLVTSAWIIAQENWLKYKSVPKKAWPKELDPLIEVELAERQPDGSVYVKGSTKAFAWLEQKQLAGKKGGQSKSQRKIEAVTKNLKSNIEADGPKRVLSGSEREGSAPKPPSPSLVLSPSLSQVPSQTQIPFQEEEGGIGAEAPHPTASVLPRLAVIWNEHRGTLPEVRHTNPTRDRKAALLIKQQSVEAWIQTIKRMATSNFCTGKNDRGWRASFDFLLKPDTWIKVNEGKYDNNKGSISTHQTRKYDKLDELEQKWRDKAKKEPEVTQ